MISLMVIDELFDFTGELIARIIAEGTILAVILGIVTAVVLARMER